MPTARRVIRFLTDLDSADWLAAFWVAYGVLLLATAAVEGPSHVMDGFADLGREVGILVGGFNDAMGANQ
jgi:hypothetical protein